MDLNKFMELKKRQDKRMPPSLAKDLDYEKIDWENYQFFGAAINPYDEEIVKQSLLDMKRTLRMLMELLLSQGVNYQSACVILVVCGINAVAVEDRANRTTDGTDSVLHLINKLGAASKISIEEYLKEGDESEFDIERLWTDL